MHVYHAVVCDPPCDNGVCVDTNDCSCAVGYSGEQCTERGIIQTLWLSLFFTLAMYVLYTVHLSISP